jgi:hypothetical protein
MKKESGFMGSEACDLTWHKMPDNRGPNPTWENVCVLRITTFSGQRTIRRDKIDGVCRLPTGAVHKNDKQQEILVYTTVLLVNGESIAVGGTRTGTSDALHACIEAAWLGDGFDPLAEREG